MFLWMCMCTHCQALIKVFWHPYFTRFKTWEHGILKILASAYGPGPYGPEPLIIWKNFLSQIYSRTISEMHTAEANISKKQDHTEL